LPAYQAQGPEFNTQYCHKKSTYYFLKEYFSWAWWHMPTILALEKLRQEDGEFKANLGCVILKPCLKKVQCFWFAFLLFWLYWGLKSGPFPDWQVF
jgi:hypothetical protein